MSNYGLKRSQNTGRVVTDLHMSRHAPSIATTPACRGFGPLHATTPVHMTRSRALVEVDSSARLACGCITVKSK